MSAGFQNHFCTAENSLGSKFISLLTRHSLADSCICHGFDKHKHISRCTAAYSACGVHQTLRYHFGTAKAVCDFKDFCQFVFRNPVIGTYSSHSGPNLCRSIRHKTDNFQRKTGFFFQPCKSLAGSDSDDGVLCRETVVDLCENFHVKLRLYCKNDSFCRSDDFIVIQSGDNTKSFFTARSAFVCKVGNNDLVL